MPSSLARFSHGSNAKLTMMILERDWSKERERKTNYKLHYSYKIIIYSYASHGFATNFNINERHLAN